MDSDEVVIINDEKEKDSDIEMVDFSNESGTELISSNDNAIVIDDDNTQTENDVIEVIDIDRDTNDKNVKDYLSKVCSENRIVGEVIEKFLDIENSSGMLRVIHRSFLPLYFKMDDTYRQSKDFKKLLDMTMRALEVYPNRKFSHMKSVCEIMKSFHKERKKVNFITLRTDAKAKPSQQKRRKRHNLAVKDNVYKKAKRKLEDIIVLDDGDEVPITNTDTEISTRITENCVAETEDIVVLEDDLDVPNNSNKENHNQSHNSKMAIQDPNLEVNISNQLLVPQKSEEYIMNEIKVQKIKSIEKQIEYYKRKIDDLEQQEVNEDSLNSPYIICEKMKSIIVKLYKDLCALTGSESIKKREVRFTVNEGRPKLPVKILEELINENIGSDGNPHFPDFMDVVKCVSKANEDDKLGWSHPRIMAEARNLFTYCGQALQENRKKRDWRYMLGRVNSKLDDDPADKDPTLMERLESNRRVAVKKEFDLMEKYVEMEQNLNRRITPFQVAQDASDDEDIDNNEFVTEINNKQTTTVSNYNTNILSTDNYELSNERYPTKEISNASKFLIARSNDQMHETNISDAYSVIQQENNVTNNIPCSKMIEISIDSNDNPNFVVISVPGNNKITDIENENRVALACDLQNSQTDKQMIEVYVENNKLPEVKVISVSSNNTDKSSLLDNTDNRIETGINEESIESEANNLVLAGNDNKNVDDSPIATGNIVIKDVYSIAAKQENHSELDTSNIADNLIEETSEDISNQKKSTEACENIGVKEVAPVTTDKNETIPTDDLNKQKCDDVNENLLQTVKIETSDVLKDMQMYGNSFTATIFDIEDPFLVIEISDSSDDSDCDMESVELSVNSVIN